MEDHFFSLLQEVSPVMTQHLEHIVPRFDEVIASRRRSSIIRTFEDLVILLIKRAVVDPSNKSTWSILNDICSDFGRSFYDTPKTGSRSNANGLEGNSLQQLDPLIVEFLSNHILQFSWRNFARALKVREGDIATIEINHEHPSTCVKEVLKIYLHQFPWESSSNNIREDILSALETLKRKDLIHKFKKLTASMRQ